MKAIQSGALAVLLAFSVFAAAAATADSSAIAHLRSEAIRSGAVAVTANLASLSLSELGDPIKRAKVRASGQRLLAELGEEVWADGRWENSAGQTGFFVTEKGVELLKNSENALSFSPGQSDALRRHRMQIGYRSIEAALEQRESTLASIFLRNEALDYSIRRDGSTTFQISAAAREEHIARVGRLIGQFQSRISVDARPAFATIAGLSIATAGAPGTPILVQVDKKALHALAHSPDVFKIELAGSADTRAQVLDTEAIEVAKRDGSAELLLMLRTPMPLAGLSTAEHGRMKTANARAFIAMMSENGITRNYRDLSEFGVVSVRLTLTEIQRLYASGDRRLLATSLNRPMGGVALATSTVQMNLPFYWNADSASFPPAVFPDAGYRGAYPSVTGDLASPQIPINIIVMDTGAQRTHPMLNGRIAFEACFGSDANVNFGGGNIVQYRSVCPDRNLTGNGDSPLNNTAGQGNPHPQGINCLLDPLLRSSCSHGTHVAGIAAGNDGGVRRGVAPSARIISVQVFSYDLAGVARPQFFAVDLLAALQAVVMAIPNSSTNSDYIVNLSLGGDLYDAPCTTGAAPGAMVPPHPTIDLFVTAVQQLRERGIPVVAATGNNSRRTEIGFPACVPGVIKVVAASNDAAGSTLAGYSNLPNPATIGSELVFLAPGGVSPAQSPVVSAWIDPAVPYTGIAGTSMAAPHVSGLYALVKAGFKKLDIKKIDGVTPHDLQDVEAWIINRASTPIPFNIAPPGQPADIRTYRRVRLP